MARALCSSALALVTASFATRWTSEATTAGTTTRRSGQSPRPTRGSRDHREADRPGHRAAVQSWGSIPGAGATPIVLSSRCCEEVALRAERHFDSSAWVLRISCSRPGIRWPRRLSPDQYERWLGDLCVAVLLQPDIAQHRPGA